MQDIPKLKLSSIKMTLHTSLVDRLLYKTFMICGLTRKCLFCELDETDILLIFFKDFHVLNRSWTQNTVKIVFTCLFGHLFFHVGLVLSNYQSSSTSQACSYSVCLKKFNVILEPFYPVVVLTIFIVFNPIWNGVENIR